MVWEIHPIRKQGKEIKLFSIKLCLITSLLKSMVIFVIWLALSSAIHSLIALFLALKGIFFSANEKSSKKRNQ